MDKLHVMYYPRTQRPIQLYKCMWVTQDYPQRAGSSPRIMRWLRGMGIACLAVYLDGTEISYDDDADYVLMLVLIYKKNILKTLTSK